MTLNPTITRRSFLQRTVLVAAGPLLAACVTSQAAAASKELLLYIGTYGPAEQDNIFLYRLHPRTGALTRVAGFRGGVKPGFLTLSTDHRYLYATLEVPGNGSGAVRAFGIDQRSGALTVLNEQPSAGAGPCYVSLTPGDKAVLVANYGGGTIGALPVQAGGQLAPAAVVDQHQGSGPHKNQDKPHAHCILPDPAGRFALAVDLGNDQILSYALNPATGLPQLPGQTAFTGQPGAGPRHLAFHPGGRWAYVINELNSTVTALSYDAAQGTFTELHTVSALPAGYAETSYCADIHVSPDGRFVYGSNRGHDSIVVLAVDKGSGRLSVVQHASTQGKTPRNFTLAPDGRLLLVANQNSNSIFSYHVDPKTGQLTPTGFSAELPAPVCLRLLADFTAG
ncbi:lactonase family protein [Hymenobacter chitinivorans]|uniref:6-phosphogluconolactonase n=1 Tax=Hymenobacter chitinivorans DSM 11115 TaxID=1121954 RepID=A0A2M9BQ34_9BACT|nr:lactonase family protein [Hymenobacter chitinivorans]PJJ60027.1 6-phosphogluconolactonase [Hymenobacter chitinivorans DSM 11115]